jgi:hypothetical protein
VTHGTLHARGLRWLALLAATALVGCESVEYCKPCGLPFQLRPHGLVLPDEEPTRFRTCYDGKCDDSSVPENWRSESSDWWLHIDKKEGTLRDLHVVIMHNDAVIRTTRPVDVMIPQYEGRRGPCSCDAWLVGADPKTDELTLTITRY